MALFTAVSKSLNYCDFFFFYFIIMTPASLYKLFKSFFLNPMQIEHRDKASDVK